MKFEIIFLGTSCMVPTKDRNHPATFLSYNGEGILIDCGENTQRQLKIAKIKPTQIKKILISHWHGDHVLGLPGLLQTISSSDYSGVLEIYGPKGTKTFFEHMFKAFIFDKKVELKITEIKKSGKLIETDNYYIEAHKLNHRVTTYGFRIIEKDRRRINVSFIKKLGIPDGPLLGDLQRGKDVTWKGKKVSYEKATYVVPGKKIGFIADTSMDNNCFKIAEDTDLLISEATYEEELSEKAIEHMHLTSRDAAQIASRSNTKRLILTHLSQRYKSPEQIKKEAQTYFNNVDIAYDFMKAKP
ncbi:MAG: ribonuclease Z [Candidatus Woesearchaeota archaeon]